MRKFKALSQSASLISIVGSNTKKSFNQHFSRIIIIFLYFQIELQHSKERTNKLVRQQKILFFKGKQTTTIVSNENTTTLTKCPFQVRPKERFCELANISSVSYSNQIMDRKETGTNWPSSGLNRLRCERVCVCVYKVTQ